MKRKDAYNILSSHLTDLSETGRYDKKELQNLSDAVELLDDLARVTTHEEIEQKAEQGIERPVVPEGACWNCKENPAFKPKCPFCKDKAKRESGGENHE